jgi:PKD domain/Putative Ig domain/FlgD Ig-like domain
MHRSRTPILGCLVMLAFVARPAHAAPAGAVSLASAAAERAVAASGPVIAVSPLTIDLGIVDNGSSATQTYTVTNAGDQTLEISAITAGGSSAIHLDASVTFPIQVAPGGQALVPIVFAPTDGSGATTTFLFVSNALNGAFSVTAIGQGNAPPTLDPIGNKTVAAFSTLSFTLSATDADDTLDDLITFTMGPGLPFGVSFDGPSGAFSWTPAEADAGTYTVEFCATDGRLLDCETIQIEVTVPNHPPVADAGGSYSGTTGVPIQFNGSATDPDIAFQTLTATWTFGDGSSASGFTPTHAYGVAGNYLATLDVCDSGTPQLCDSNVAPVAVVNEIAVQIILKNDATTLHVGGGGRERIGIEETIRTLTDIDVTSIRLTSSATGSASIACSTKGVQFGDMDGDGVTDIDVVFSGKDLATLFSGVPNNTTVTLVVTGIFAIPGGGIPFRGEKTVTIKKGGGAALKVAAYPNPFNPETAIAYTTRNCGPLTMRIYSIDGRLVRTLKDGEFTAAGTYEVQWNGVDNSGHSAPSGVYFVKTTVLGETSVYKIALAR